ncbi:MAG TPA: CorA family divalent cation transporter [Myxococcaceae bacterium]|nr:CorA family divalent cation transporter [Myxococcaceae bacterium]
MATSPLDPRPERADGRLWAVRLVPGETAARPVENPLEAGAGWVWAHFDLVSANARQGLSSCELPAEVAALFAEVDETPRLLAEGEWLAGVVPDFEHSPELDEVRTGAWRFFLRERLLVSGRRVPLRGVHEAWRALSSGVLPPRADAAFQRVRRAFLDEAARLANVLQSDLDRVEDDLLESEGAARRQARAGALLGRVRQRIARLQRATKPLARLALRDAAPPWLDTDGMEALQRRTLGVLDDLGAVQDRSHALQDELNARQNEETNRRLYILSVVTVVLAPTTLITGFFGMNTGGLPWTQLPYGTALASALLAGCIGLVLWLLRRVGML